MFDWNDEELTNIIWDEAGKSDDHIVPYPEAVEDCSKKKEWSQEANNTKSNEQKAPGAEIDIHGRKHESSSNFDTSEGASASGFGIDSWPNLSLSTAAKTDQDSLDTSVSNNLTEITKFDSSGGETVQLDKETEIFQKGKDQGHFVDYGWANIGSFDDLDRIFSNDDPIFGNVSLSNPDELWSSSKDVTNNSPGKSFPIYSESPTLGLGPLRNTSDLFEIKTEYAQDDDQPFTLDYGKVNDPASHGLQNASAVLNQVEYAGGKSKPILMEQNNLTIVGQNTAASSQLSAEKTAASNELAQKVYKKKKTLKSQKKLEEKSDLALYQDMYGNWSSAGNLPGQFKNQFAPNVVRSPSVLSQQMPLQGPGSLQYQQISNPLVAPSAYGTVANPYSAMPVLSHIQSGEYKHQPVLSGYEVSSGSANPVNKSADSLVKSQTMTPQEKIEKLRKRQQMQAMLGIQKQQQQFGHQVPCSDQSITSKSKENQIQSVEGADLEVEDLSTFPAFDPNSPIEQDDSSTISLAVNDYSAEDTVLYRLQDIVTKLDVRIRLCIRDSLFRLAQSATQRHYASDTSSTNNSSRDEQVITKDDTSHNRNAKMSEVETETNPIDRTVAHLLFYRPLELSGKHPDTPESPASTKFPSEQKPLGFAKPSMGCLPETVKSKQIFSHQGSQSSYSMAGSHPLSQCKSTVCIDTSGNASNSGPADEGVKDVEPSQ